MMITTVTLQAMTYTQAREETLFLTDKMAYELGLYESQYDAVYEINLDYLMALNYQDDLYSTCWTRRNLDLSYVLTAAQYNLYMSRTYFYRPVYWSSGFRYSIYTRYTDRSYYYYSRPSVYTTNHSGHSVTTTPKPSKPTNQGHTVTAPKPSTGTASHGRPTTNKKPTTSAGKPATGRPSRGTGTSGSTTVKPSGSFSGSRPTRTTSAKPSTTTQKTTPTKGFSGKR